MKKRGTRKSFTLVELLIVIAIISVGTAFILFSVKNGQSRARDTQRLADLAALDSAIKTYYLENGHYPSLPGSLTGGTGCGAKTTFSDGTVSWIAAGSNPLSSNTVSSWAKGECFTSDFIPGLVPKYISKLPTDPGPVDLILSPSGNNRGYLYYHMVNAGIECYKIVAHAPENPKISASKELWDPRRDGGDDYNIMDGTSPWAWANYSRGCAAK